MRDQVKEVQALTETHGEALLGASDKLARLESEVRGLEELVDAVQGIAAKQFRLLSSVIGQGARKAPIVGNSSKKSSIESTFVDEKNKTPVIAVGKGDNALQATQEEAEIKEKSNSGRDEWGRAVMAQSLRNEKEEEEGKVSNEKSGAGAMVLEERPSAAVNSINDGRKMEVNDDGSVSFSF